MGTDDAWKSFLRKMKAVAEASVASPHFSLHHVALRVNDLDQTEELLAKVFGLDSMVRYSGDYPGFPGEKRMSLVWLGDVYLELVEQESPSTIGYDTGLGLPIGHLNEIGYFVADLSGELDRLRQLGWVVQHVIEGPGLKMAKVDTDPPSGVPMEIMELTGELDQVIEETEPTADG